jgi:hypothetical protein
MVNNKTCIHYDYDYCTNQSCSQNNSLCIHYLNYTNFCYNKDRNEYYKTDDLFSNYIVEIYEGYYFHILLFVFLILLVFNLVFVFIPELIIFVMDKKFDKNNLCFNIRLFIILEMNLLLIIGNRNHLQRNNIFIFEYKFNDTGNPKLRNQLVVWKRIFICELAFPHQLCVI